MKRVWLACAIALLLTGAPVHAQQRDSLWVELLTGMFGSPLGAPRDRDVFFGEVPPGFNTAYLPPGARVVGSVFTAEGLNVVAAVQGRPDDVAQVMESRMIAAGVTTRSFEQRSGFVPSSRGNAFYYCADRVRGVVSAFARDSVNTFLRITQHSWLPGPCEDVPPRSTTELGPPLPLLVAPQLSAFRGSSGGGSSDGWHTSTQVETGLGVRELLAHYAQQLAEDGWTVQEPSSLDNAAIAVVRRRFVEGGTWVGALITISVPGAPLRDVYLRLSRIE